MSYSDAYPLSEGSSRYWKKKGLLPDPGDSSLIGKRRRRFLQQCLAMGFRPARLLKLKEAAHHEQKELHQLVVYRSEAGVLSHDLVIQRDSRMEEPGTGQLLFSFSAPMQTEVSVLPNTQDRLQTLFADSPEEEELERRLQQYLDEHPDSPEAWIEMGNLQYRRGRFGDAIRSYEQAHALDGSCAEALYNIAGCHVQREEYAAAIRAYHSCIQIRPLPEAFYSLGLLYLSLNYREPALQAFQAVVQIGEGEWAESARQLIEDIEQLSLYGDAD